MRVVRVFVVVLCVLFERLRRSFTSRTLKYGSDRLQSLSAEARSSQDEVEPRSSKSAQLDGAASFDAQQRHQTTTLATAPLQHPSPKRLGNTIVKQGEVVLTVSIHGRALGNNRQHYRLYSRSCLLIIIWKLECDWPICSSIREAASTPYNDKSSSGSALYRGRRMHHTS